jgi:hypothetical protein
MNAILELLKLALVGLISGVFSYYLTFRKHRFEKWWELRVTAYQEVIAALSDLHYYFESYFKSELSQRDMSDAKEKELKLLWENAYHKVRKAADVGAFLFSTEAETALNTFIKGQNKHYGTSYEWLDGRCADAKKCLDALVSCSKADLRLGRSFLMKYIKGHNKRLHRIADKSGSR